METKGMVRDEVVLGFTNELIRTFNRYTAGGVTGAEIHLMRALANDYFDEVTSYYKAVAKEMAVSNLFTGLLNDLPKE